ncbi:MAG: zinc ABC transporter substrate-binding protein [Deltaproteobacteria bacterium]
MMKKVIFIILTLISFATPSFAEINVVATLPWIGSLAKEIGKDSVNVKVLVKPGQDPHFVEAKPSMTVAARNADIIMYNGLDLEAGYLPLIITSSRNHRIQPGQKGNFDSSRYVNAIEKLESADRSMGDVHPFGNPHYHFSPENILHVTEGIAEALSRIDQDNAKFYNANLTEFRDRFKEKQREWNGKALKLKGKKFIAYHKLFEYLAKDFGFGIIGYVEPKPGIPPSAAYIKKLIELIKQERPDAILTTSSYGLKESELLAKNTGLRVVILPQDVGATDTAKDWFSFIDQTLLLLD